jgi:hypothetical protein
MLARPNVLPVAMIIQVKRDVEANPAEAVGLPMPGHVYGSGRLFVLKQPGICGVANAARHRDTVGFNCGTQRSAPHPEFSEATGSLGDGRTCQPNGSKAAVSVSTPS